jgi:hypothetical protein
VVMPTPSASRIAFLIMAQTPPKSGDVATAAEMGREDRAAVPRFHKNERAMEKARICLSRRNFAVGEAILEKLAEKLKDFLQRRKASDRRCNRSKWHKRYSMVSTAREGILALC